jgi:hypothetical protein
MSRAGEYLLSWGDRLLEMAFDRKAAMDKLRALQLPITRHLYFLAAYPDHEAAAGWTQELQAWQDDLVQYNRAKSKSGVNYSPAILLRSLWTEPLSTDGDRATVARIAKRKGLPDVAVDPVALKALVDKFINCILTGVEFQP